MPITQVKKKTVKPFVFLHAEKVTAYEKVPEVGQKIMDGLEKLITKNGIVVVGPPMWTYVPVKGKLKLRAGYPVKKGSRGKAPFTAKTEPGWKCMSAEFQGPMTKIIEAWMELFEAAAKKGLDWGMERREIYRKWVGVESGENVTELQVRVG